MIDLFDIKDNVTVITGGTGVLGRTIAKYLALNGAIVISTIKTSNKADGKWYNLSGQKVAQPTKGIFIHNGKKIVIK